MDNPLIIFDGVCNLCNSTVNFVIKEDKKQIFLFSLSQSEYAQKILMDYVLSQKKNKSVILIENNKAYTESTAILRVLKNLGGYYKLFYFVMLVIPVQLRNLVYTILAENRYKWFGKRENCIVPTDDIISRFYN